MRPAIIFVVAFVFCMCALTLIHPASAQTTKLEFTSANQLNLTRENDWEFYWPATSETFLTVIERDGGFDVRVLNPARVRVFWPDGGTAR